MRSWNEAEMQWDSFQRVFPRIQVDEKFSETCFFFPVWYFMPRKTNTQTWWRCFQEIRLCAAQVRVNFLLHLCYCFILYVSPLTPYLRTFWVIKRIYPGWRLQAFTYVFPSAREWPSAFIWTSQVSIVVDRWQGLEERTWILEPKRPVF